MSCINQLSQRCLVVLYGRPDSHLASSTMMDVQKVLSVLRMQQLGCLHDILGQLALLD